MAEEQDYVFKHKRGTSAEWAASNYILAEGEPGINTDNDNFKYGDGIHSWNDLLYFLNETGVAVKIAEALDAYVPDVAVVNWDALEGKPSSFPPSTHNHDSRYYTEAEIDDALAAINTDLAGKAAATHNHDSRYYTETEVETIVANAVSAEASARTTAIGMAIAGLINASPDVLNTLDEIAAALGDDPDFAAHMTTALAGKQTHTAVLDSLSGLASAANKLPYFAGVDTLTMTDFTSLARTLLGCTTSEQVCAALGFGTSVTRDAPASGNASSSQVVLGNDSRLSDNRAPTAHSHPTSQISDATTKGRELIVAADAAAVRTAAGLGTAAVLNTGTASGDIPVLGSGGRLALARIVDTAGADGTKFLADDGTLKVPAGTGGGGVLAYSEYASSSGAISTSSGTMVEADATNLKVSFVAPTAGKVLVRLEGWISAAPGLTYNWGILDGATVKGDKIMVYSPSGQARTSVTFYVSGLTPGVTYTYKWGHYCSYNPGGNAGEMNMGAKPSMTVLSCA